MSETNPDLDLSFLYEIADGSNEFIVESIDMFLQQTPELLQNITNAIEAKDWTTAGAAAHKLKPNLGFFGMLESQQMIQDVELMAKKGAEDPELLTAIYEQVRGMINNNLTKLVTIKAQAEAQL